MNYAQEFFSLEEQKQNLLQKSKEDAFNHYFCLINVQPVGFLYPNLAKGLEKSGAMISFEIVAFPKNEPSYSNKSSSFYSIELTTTLKLDNKETKTDKLTYSHSLWTTVKHLNPKGVFFVSNYDTLSEQQKKELQKSIVKYYDKAQDPYDDHAIPRLEVRNIVGYIKGDNTSLKLEDFMNEIGSQVESIVENHLSNFVVETLTKGFDKSERLYHLTQEEKKSLVKDIRKSLISSVKEVLKNQKVDKDSGQAYWTQLHNEVSEYFSEKDNSLSKQKKLKK